MTGINFKFLNRKNERLTKLVEKYLHILAKAGEMYDTKIRYGEGELERYYELQDQLKQIARKIWVEAFYTYGRTNKSADEYCQSRGIPLDIWG